MIHSEGVEYAVNHDSVAHELVKEGYAVLLTDLPGIGSMGPGYFKGDSYIDGVSYNQWFAAMLTGRSFVGLHAEDIIRVVQFVKDHMQVLAGVSVLATGPLGSDLLHAALFEPDIKRVCLVNSFLSYADIASIRFYKPDFVPFLVPGAIEDYDLPDLMASLCPREILIIDPVSGDGSIASEAKAQKILTFPSDVYIDKNVPQHFKVINSRDQQSILRYLLSWLQ
jgi:hypothetical protein